MMGVKIDETTVYAFGLRISDADAASALSGSRRGGRFRGGSREFEIGCNDGFSRRVHSLALKEDGTVWAWGIITVGLGDGSTTDRLPPFRSGS